MAGRWQANRRNGAGAPSGGHNPCMPDTGDVDDEYRFVRWVEDPGGVQHCVQGVKTFGVTGPAFLWAEGAVRLVQRVLVVLNKGLVRTQRPRSFEGCHLRVFRMVADRHELAFDDEADDWEGGRRRAEQLAEEIRTGRFVARGVNG